MAAKGAIHSTTNPINHHFLRRNQPDQVPCLRIASKSKKFPVFASISSSDSPHIRSSPPVEVLKNDSHSRNAVLSDNSIDYWMQESVAQIIQNLKQAPLLVQIYSEDDGVRARIKTEEAVSWPFLKIGWENDGVKSPDVLMFVEELNTKQDLEEGANKFWGIVVQGKGTDSVPDCYLLKTNRICAGIGLGFCTHFCLMKVINFRDSAHEQFKDCWLLQ